MSEEELLKRLEGIEHHLCPHQAYWLYQQALAMPSDGMALEIGTFGGCSAAAMALACVGTERLVYTVDVKMDCLIKATSNWCRLKVGRYVRAHNADSTLICQLAETWCFPRFNLAFIDGDHIAHAPARDFMNVIQLMAPGGRIAFHDVIETWPDVERTWKEIAAPKLKNWEFCGSIASGIV